MIEILPSLLAADFARIGEQLEQVAAGGARMLHFDVMDGHFVPNISFGPLVARTMKRITKTPLDVHLMITDPNRYSPEFVEAGVEIIYAHAEAAYDVYRTVQLITDLGAKAGIALNPGSPAEWVEPLLDKIDYVLVMSVCPGFGGQKFQPESIRKIHRLRRLLDERKPSVQIAVDGGVSRDNIKALRDAGANFFVAGSSVFGAKDITRAVQELREAAGR